MKNGALPVTFWIFGLTEEIVDGDIVEVCQLDQDLSGNVPLAKFIVAVGPLGTVQIFGQLALL